jgi:hypothetical protein
MKRASTATTWALAVLLWGIGATSAAAQALPSWTDRGFVNVNVGTQTEDRRSDVTGSFPIYGETASYEASFTSGKGRIFDLSGGVRVFGNFAVALGYTRYHDSYDSTITGMVPDPLVFDIPHAVSLPLPGLERTESGVHLSAVFALPLHERLEVMVFAGPSFIALDQNLLGSVSVVPGGTALDNPTTATVSGTGNGGHIGLDVSYVAFRTAGLGIGVGVFLRQSSATVDAPEVDSGEVKVGGFNYGIGARLRF